MKKEWSSDNPYLTNPRNIILNHSESEGERGMQKVGRTLRQEDQVYQCHIIGNLEQVQGRCESLLRVVFSNLK
jgi:hypothetical protein